MKIGDSVKINLPKFNGDSRFNGLNGIILKEFEDKLKGSKLYLVCVPLIDKTGKLTNSIASTVIPCNQDELVVLG